MPSRTRKILVVYSSAHPEFVSKPPFVTPSANTKKLALSLIPKPR